MTTNSVPPIAQAVQPRGIVKINGVRASWISWTININNYYQADNFRVSLPLYDPVNINNGIDLEYWESQPAILIEILAGFPPDPQNYTESDLQSLFLGGVEDMMPTLHDGLLTISGRDFTKKLIDNKTIEKYPNKTASEIAILLAEKEGLTPVVTPTTTPVGQYYDIDYVQLNDAKSEWELLVYLAQQEDFLVYVKGQSLYFQPKPTDSTDPYLLQWIQPTAQNASPQFGGVQLSISRNLNLARDVIVKVRNWNKKTAKRQDISVRATHSAKTVLKGAAQPLGDAQVYTYRTSGLTPQQALLFGQRKLQQISQHERILSTTLPGDNLLGKASVIKVQGVSKSSDQIYYPDEITRKMSVPGGYCMRVRAKNHSPQSIVII